MSNEDKLRFLVAFCGQDLDGFRPGDWLNLRDDLGKFLGEVQGQELTIIGRVLLCANESFEGYTTEHIRALQQEVTRILQAVAISALQEKLEAKKRASKETHISTGALPSTQTTISWTPSQHHAFGCVLLGHGSIRDVALTCVVLLIAEHPFRVMKCPECGTLFFRNKKQQFCSSRCGDRLYMRLRRQKEAVRDRESDSNHRQYAKRVRQKTGRNVSIGRKRRTQ